MLCTCTDVHASLYKGSVKNLGPEQENNTFLDLVALISQHNLHLTVYTLSLIHI